MKKILLSLLMLCCMTSAWAQDDGFINVATTKQLWDAIQKDASAKVRLTADFALSDINKDGETYCETFYGTIDGNGHTIKGDPVADIRARTYMFTYCDGATIKNLTFKGIRIDNRNNSNQAVIASQAKNGCVFENITFDHISTYTSYDNTGAVVGHANTNCTFKNITVKNSDFTVNENQAGAVVGHAKNCTFENIKVEHCESTARDSYSGGVVGRANDCIISDVEILGTFIKTYGECGGGVAGYSSGTQFTNCVVDDQSCVCVDGSGATAHAGGIVGVASNSKLYNCINSALVAAALNYVGGITGNCSGSDIVGCLNTGLVIHINMDDVLNGFYNKYKTKSGMTCVTKTYQGKEYVIRKYEGNGKQTLENKYGGIAGFLPEGNVSKCVNFGSIYCPANIYAVGGIVGEVEIGTISDCLVDFSGDGYGICRFDEDVYLGHEASVNNCLNMTTYKDIDAYKDKWRGFSGGNNYSLTTSESAPHATKTTAAKIKSGEICLKLGANWEQNLGTDAYPTPTGDKGVYHTRTVSNQYGTVCLPFSVQSDDKISYYSLSRKEEDGQGIKLVFTYNEDRILEGTPLLFRSAEAKDADADNPVEICFNNAGEEFTTIPTNKILDAGFWDLWGTFEQRVFEGDLAKHIYYVSGGEIRNAKKATIAPYRAWIYGENIDNLTGSSAQARAIRFVLGEDDGESLALELVGEDLVPVQQGAKSYSLMGTEVGDGYRGLVIRNGKKVILNR